MAEDTKYNGWTNYETWCVGLWLDNDRSTYEMFRVLAARAKNDAPLATQVKDKIWTVDEATRFKLADDIKAWVEENNPCADRADMFADLMNAALSEVNWTEIATNMIVGG